MSGRLLRSAWWPLLTAAAASLALAITLWLRHARPGIARDAFRLAVIAAALLSAAWLAQRGSQAVRALWRAAGRHRALRREGRRGAQRTILLHLPPHLEAQVDQNAGRIDGLEPRLACAEAAVAAVADIVARAYRTEGLEVPEPLRQAESTAPLPVVQPGIRLAARDGRRLA